MSTLEPTLQDSAMVHRIFGWHVVPWTDAFCEALGHLGTHPATVLEIGASRLSAPSLFFLSKGASVDVTCYAETEVPALTGVCERICREYGLPEPEVRVHDAFAATARQYDLIIMKGVLGGLDRSHKLDVFARVVGRCMDNLSDKGVLLLLDKGWCSSVHNLLLQRFGDAGGNHWHYFSHQELASLAGTGARPQVFWKGFISAGTMPGKGLQRIADWLDTRLFNRFLTTKGTVFAALYRKDVAQPVDARDGQGVRAPSADIDK